MVFDIIVVGGGPAGLMATKTAAEYGLKVVLLDTKNNIARYTRPCRSMWILEPGFHNEAWSFKDDKIFFHRNDFVVKYKGKWVDLYRSTRFSPSGHTLIMGKRNFPIARVPDKQILCEGLLEECQLLGVDIRSASTGLEAKEEKDQVRLKIRHLGGCEWISGKWLLAADGVNSRITESLGFNKNRKMIFQTRLTLYHYAGVETPYADSWTRFIGYGFNGVGGSLLRKADRDGLSNVFEVHAHAKQGENINQGEAIKRLITHPLLDDWFKDAELVRKMGCTWTLWEPIKNPARGRTILVGDAPSFQEVENQGALMCGFRAVKAVEKEMNGEPGMKEYNNFWQESFEFNDDKVLRECCRGAWMRNLSNDQLDYLFKLAEGRLLDGYINHFKCGNVILNFFDSQLERIQKERPDIVKSLHIFNRLTPEQAFMDPNRLAGKVKGNSNQ
jgi:flavin-dependent dehydrogenase